MTALKSFLEEAFKSLKRWRDFENIHIVLGNEACDLDSTICSLAYGFYLSRKLQNQPKTAVFPIVNVPSDEFPIRTEHCSLLKDINIDIKKLIYRSNTEIDEMICEKKNIIKTYLVDHHVLNEKDKLFKETVCKIFDHRPRDATYKWSPNTELRIEPVGSCATIIVDEIIKEGILEKELAYLLYCTIVFDTLAVLPENKKATPLDIETAKKLEEKFNFTEPRLDLFQKLVNLHADTSKLTPDQILIRDLKFVGKIPIPSLPTLVETFSRSPGIKKSLQDMGTKKHADFIVLIGLEAKPEVRRDVGIYFVKEDADLKNRLLEEMKDHRDFEFVEITCEVSNMVVFKQNNIEKSRKQIIPIIKSFMEKSLN